MCPATTGAPRHVRRALLQAGDRAPWSRRRRTRGKRRVARQEAIRASAYRSSFLQLFEHELRPRGARQAQRPQARPTRLAYSAKAKKRTRARRPRELASATTCSTWTLREIALK